MIQKKIFQNFGKHVLETNNPEITFIEDKIVIFKIKGYS